MMSGAPQFEREGRRWPWREASRFIAAGGLTWHVQDMGAGPALLLLHGTASASHSWRGLLPLLARQFRVIAPDLPGHGFTRGRLKGRPDLPGMAAALRGLLKALGVEPALLAGHSAGVGIALELARGGLWAPVAGFGAALLPFPGPAARLFPAMAKLLVLNPFAPRLFAGMVSRPAEAERFLIRSTGSRIDAEGMACYATLLANHRHCEGALAMMAHWDLAALAQALPQMAVPVLLAHGGRDASVPLASAREAARLLPQAQLVEWPGLGHLAHEEAPDQAAALIEGFARRLGVLRQQSA